MRFPAGEYTYVGTTDTDWSGDPSSAVATADDVSYVIDAVNANFLTKLNLGDVTATWAGVRPLIAEEGSPSPSDVSRDYEIRRGPAGVYTICGGKLTTARSMAEDLLNRVIEKEGAAFSRKPARCRTDRVPLPGAVPGFDRYRAQATADLVSGWGLSPAAARNLVNTYGVRHTKVLGLAARDVALLAPLCDGGDELLVQATYAAREEMAVTLEDFLRRRSNLMLFGPPGRASAFASAAGVFATVLGWDEAEKMRQLAAVEREVKRMMSFAGNVPGTPTLDR